MAYYLYIINSGDERYIGTTKDIKGRLHRHNSGENKSTKHRKNWVVKYFERYDTLSELEDERCR